MNTESTIRANILVLEDETDLQEAVVTYLNMEGYVADGVGSLRAATQWLRTHRIDVLVIDLGLPDGDGLEWLQQRPELRDAGVVVITARGEKDDRLRGIRGGADAYLVKPVALDELASLIGNLVRRLRANTRPTWLLHRLTWTLQSPDGPSIKLTHTESLVVDRLIRTPGQPVDRDHLVEALGEDPIVYDPRRMEILIRRLRVKAREALGYELPLETVHRVGYAFTAPIQLVDG
jgi:DNA-binding response OmpR family regulator